MIASVFKLMATLGLNTSDYDKGLDNSEKKASTFGSKLKTGLGTAGKVGAAAITAVAAGATALGSALSNGVKKTAAAGDEIDKMSQKLGLSAEAYQEWGYVLELAGADINSMSVGLKTLTNKLDDAKNGSETAQKMFEKLGLSMEDLSTMSREDVFAAAITGFQGMADSTERAALANDLFGKSGQELTPLFNTSIEETNELRKAAHDLGFVMSDESVKAAAAYEDSLTTLQNTMGGVKRSFLEEFLPSFTDLMDGITLIFSGDEEGGVAKINAGVDSLITSMSEKVPQFMDIGFRIVDGLLSALVNNLPLLIEKGADLILNGIIPGIIEHLPDIVLAAVQIVGKLAQSIGQSLPTLIPAAISMLLEIVDTLLEPQNIGLLIDGAIALITGLADGLISSLPLLIERVPEIIIKLLQAIVENAPKLLEAGWELIKKLVEGLSQGFQKLAEVGKRLVEGLWNGIKDAAGWIWGKIKEFAGGIVDRLKNFFGIHSPSTVFRDTIGKNLMLGFAEGIDKYGVYGVDAMDDWVNDINKAAQVDGIEMTDKSAASQDEYGGRWQFVQNVYAEKMTPAQVFDECVDAFETQRFLGLAPSEA